ncbi:MAG TPA: TylF/MycF/NovP-related O-methyltransferase [Longimicrobium sp.]|jgi:hypothetical protein
MDMAVHEGSRIARLPAFLRRPALIVRNLRASLAPAPAPPARRFRFEGDGLGTDHFSPFVDDAEFTALYESMKREWFVDADVGDVRWRMWLLTRCARQCSGLAGSFAEFGVYRAGCAFMILATRSIAPGQRFFLFDTFQGIPAQRLLPAESEHGFAGRWADTSAEYVRERLAPWRDALHLVPGDVFETLPRTETGPIAFSHVDLNAAAPTLAVLEYLYPRLVKGAMLVFDDYGFGGYEEQRRVVDEFFASRPEQVLATPAGPALVVKL